MFPFRYFRRHALALVLLHAGVQTLASALAVDGAVERDPRGREKDGPAPEAGSAALRPAGGADGSPPRPGTRAGDPRGWEQAVLAPEGDAPLLGRTPVGAELGNQSREDISVISAWDDEGRRKAPVEKIAGIPTALAVLMAVAAAVNAILCCALCGSRQEGLPQRNFQPSVERPRGKGSISSLGGSMMSAARLKQRMWPVTAAPTASRNRRDSGRGSSSEIESQAGTIDDSTPSMMTDQMPIMEAKDIVLCPLLVVPANNRCVCLVTMCATSQKQDVVVPVRGVGGADLFKIRMSESGAGGSRIQVETVDSNVLAYVSTDPLWRTGGSLPTPSPREGARSPGERLRICWPSGRPFGCLRNAGNRAWAVQMDGREQDVLSFVGELRGGNVSVNTLRMQSVASAETIGREFRATVRAHCDAGLVMLALVAIEKCEALAAAAAVTLAAAMAPATTLAVACRESPPTVGELAPPLAAERGASKADALAAERALSGSTHGVSNSASNSASNSVTNSDRGATNGNSSEPRSDEQGPDASRQVCA